MDLRVFQKWEVLVSVIAIATAVFVVLLFAINVGRIADFNFSTNASDWGNFGSYFGGVAGSVFALFAFFGVLATIYLQLIQLQRQSEEFERQENRRVLAELHRVVSDTYREIESILKIHVTLHNPELVANFPNGAPYHAMIWAQNSYEGLSNEAESQDRKQYWSKLAKKLDDEVHRYGTLLRTSLRDLQIALETYRDQGGSTEVVNLYRMRYMQIVRMMYESENMRVSLDEDSAKFYFAVRPTPNDKTGEKSTSGG